MARKSLPPKLSFTMAVVSFLVALVPASGLVLRGDFTGRVIFVVVWILVGLAWLGSFFQARKKSAA